MDNINILLIEDSPEDARLIQEMLLEGTADAAPFTSFNLHHADRLASGLVHLSQADVGAILLDLSLPDSQGLDTVTKVRAQTPHTPIIALTGLEDVELAVQALQQGIQDFLVKRQLNSQLLIHSIRHILGETHVRRVIEASADGVLVVDQQGIIRFANQAARAIFGQPAERLMGKPFGFPIVAGETAELEIPQSDNKSITAEMRVTNIEWEGQAALLASLRDITERKRTQQALQASEVRFRSLIEASSDIIAIIDADGTLRYVSPSGKRVLGNAPEEMVGKNIIEFIHPDDLTATLNAISIRIEQGGVAERPAEFRIRHADGTWHTFEAIGTNLLDNPAVAGIVINARDITDRKRAEETLRESEARLQSLFDTMAKGVILIAPDGQIVQANRAAERILGLARSEITTRNYITPGWKVIRPDGTPMPPEEMAGPRAMKEKQIVKDVVMGIEHPDGAIRWINVSASPLFNQSGELMGIVGTFGDITARKQAEKALQQERDFARHVMNTLGQGVTVIDSEGKFTYVNPAYARMIGVAPEELIGKRPADVTVPEDQSILADAQRERQSGEMTIYETRLRRTDGEAVPVLITGTPRWQDGKVIGAIAAITDLTEQKRAETQITRQNAILSATNQVLQQALTCENDAEVAQACLAAAERLTDSKFGFIGELNYAGHFDTIAISNPGWDVCKMPHSDATRLTTDMPIRGIDRSTLREGKSRIVNDPAAHPDRVGTPEGHPPITAFLGVPLQRAGRTMGMIGLANKAAGYDLVDQQAIEALSVAFVEALDRKRAEQAEREQRTRAVALARTAARLNAQLDWDAVLNAVCEETARALNVPAASVTQLNAARGELDLTSSVGLPNDYVQRHKPIPQTRYDELAQNAGAVGVVPDAQQLANWPNAELDARHNVRTVASAKMEREGALFGTLNVYALGETRTFTDDELAFLRGIADQATQAIANARLFEQEQTRREELAALYDLARALADADDQAAILSLVARRAVEIIRVTFTRVVLLERDQLIVRAAHPIRVLDRDLQVGHREPLSAHPLCQRILEENKPMLLRADSPEAGECQPFFLDLAQSLCIVPLRVGDNTIGWLMLGEARKEEREPFSENKLRLARNIADQAASALHREMLREQTERRLERIAAMHNIDTAITSSFDLRLTLNVVLDQAIQKLRVDAADVLLLSPHSQTLEFAAGRGFRSQAIERSRLRLGEGHAGRAALEHRIVSIPDLRAVGAEFVRAALLAGEEFVCYHSAPLVVKGQVKGVLEVFHRTPLDPDPEWLNFLETLAEQAAIAVDSAGLFSDLQRANVDLTLAYDSTIEGWSRALDLRDKETEGHTQRVTEITLRLAKAMGIGDAELVHVRCGALLHDIGKMGVPDTILLKPDKLTDAEWKIMRQHPQFAYDMLAPIAYLKPALDIPYCHHEKWDGSGYPRGLKGEQIPLVARIFAVVDVWDALRSDRPYRKAWDEEKVREHILASSGTHFDPKVVEVFLANLAR